MRDMNPANGENWKVVCSHCGMEFFDAEQIDLTDGHYQQEHPGEPVAFNTVWVGVGPPPKGGYSRPARRKIRRR